MRATGDSKRNRGSRGRSRGRTPRLLAWLLPALAAAGWAALGFLGPLPARSSEEPPAETSGLISWVDPQAGSFGLDTGEEELEFVIGPETVVTRDGRSVTLEEVQPGDWAAACTWRPSVEKRLCLRLEIQTPPEEEGLE